MHGIPVIIKDNYDTGDMPTSAGSLALATSQPARDGFVVQRLREAGAIILAKSNLHELAAGITSISSLGGQTRNPYDPTRCPGGSSGGTGAAIAASFAAVGWGSDTCGSIRYPSAYASLFGLRPTMGMVSRAGIVPLSHTQDIGGPLARTATDLAIALDVTVGYDSADATTRVLRDAPRLDFPGSKPRPPWGEMDVVRQWGPLTDCNSPAHWNGDTLYVFNSWEHPARIEGKSLTTLGEPRAVTIDNDANISTGTSLAPGIDLRQFPAEMNLPQLGYVRVGNRTIVAHRTTRRVVRVITH
jgi:hypothetical protein